MWLCKSRRKFDRVIKRVGGPRLITDPIEGDAQIQPLIVMMWPEFYANAQFLQASLNF